MANNVQNIFELINDEYYIGYTQSGKEFYFDKDDYELIRDYCWDIDGNDGYVKTIDRINKSGKLYLHRIIMGCNKNDGKIVDHINRRKNDNRKSNLRIVNSTQSAINKGIRSNNISGKTGVCFNKSLNKWESYIKINKKKKHLGVFESFEDAKQARVKAEELYFGKYNPQFDNVL